MKSRTQTKLYGPLASWRVAHRLFTTDGLPGFYRGFGITIMREIPFTSIQFPLYEFLKLQLAKWKGTKRIPPSQASVCGCVAGGVAAALTTPLDVLKTRVMLDQGKSTILTHFQNICKNEGTSTLFSGIVPRTLWISAGGAVFLGVYEWALDHLITS